MRKISHITHYSLLFGILILGTFGFWFFSYDKIFQAVIAVAVSISYVAWGIMHHYIHKDLCLEIIMEYVFMAILGLIVIFSLIFVKF